MRSYRRVPADRGGGPAAHERAGTGERRAGPLRRHSPCPFDITFTGTGELTFTTYYDNTGRLVLAADASELSFAGNSVVNTSELCAALSP